MEAGGRQPGDPAPQPASRLYSCRAAKAIDPDASRIRCGWRP
jgi:hypothetical protein